MVHFVQLSMKPIILQKVSVYVNCSHKVVWTHVCALIPTIQVHIKLIRHYGLYHIIKIEATASTPLNQWEWTENCRLKRTGQIIQELSETIFSFLEFMSTETIGNRLLIPGWNTMATEDGRKLLVDSIFFIWGKFSIHGIFPKMLWLKE